VETSALKTGVMAALFVAATGLVCAQGAPAGQSANPASPQPPATATPPPAGEAYTYDPAGRRDPFVSLLSRGLESSTDDKVTGLAGLATGEVMLRGVIQSRNSYIALVSGPDGKTHSARVNDRLLDGIIRSVTPQGIVIMQDVNDPLSLVKQREVRKGLRTADDGK
jgi:type IV pilus assembly protein PilP